MDDELEGKIKNIPFLTVHVIFCTGTVFLKTPLPPLPLRIFHPSLFSLMLTTSLANHMFTFDFIEESYYNMIAFYFKR